jgi:tRNA G10  N-methylase Trm11
VTNLLRDPAPRTHAFVADATDAAACTAGLGDLIPDVVLTDTPYGEQTTWADAGGVGDLLQSLAQTTAPGAILALVTPNRLRLPATTWQRAGTWTIGKRRLWALRNQE